MISKETISEVKSRLIQAYNPLAVYLFGSYAWGNPNEESDLDILIVIESSTEKTFERPRIGQQALFGLSTSKDILVFTKEEFDRYSTDQTTLCYKIKNDGEVLYATNIILCAHS